MSYQGRLKSLELTTSEERRKRGDLIHMYKLMKEYESIKWENINKKYETGTHRASLQR